ncbi:ABC transporter ATP-binding protein [Gracilimonas sp.]|uniref:ABC transporter ATP-binding protein n=1 Tax=Gracilimonas sp. TaxID=1974203 RepID=UPI002871B4BC|nr:ATP-binding cassette domain-containing protein [Gracilimonas sp.]
MIEVKNLSKSFGDEKVLKELSFTHQKHQTLSILGESGSGKSTLLKIMAGLLDEFTGDIQVDEKSIGHLKPQDRGAVYLYQEPLLFTHLNVEENIAFGLRIKGEDSERVAAETARMIQQLKLTGQEKKYPNQLSGGQKQRVAFGRAFIIHPRILLLDEPFASLDPGTREEMQILFKEIAEKEKITSLFVTHDLKEALMTGDRFGMMIDGKLKVYESREDFIEDSGTGVKQEIEFWRNLK